jgi:hypothetical protein
MMIDDFIVYSLYETVMLFFSFVMTRIIFTINTEIRLYCIILVQKKKEMNKFRTLLFLHK